MTVVNPKSISGINSITMASGSDDLLTIHSNNTTERVRVNNSGDVIVGSGVTLSPDGDIFATGVTTATSFVGDGSQLTGVASTENIRTNTNATFLQNINVSGSTTTGSLVSSGAISGTTGTFTSHVSLGDNDQLRIGDGDDLQIYHDTSNTVLVNNTGDLYIQNDTSNDTNKILIRPKAGEGSIECVPNAEVSLWHDNTKQCYTSANGLAFPSGKGIDFSATSDAGGMTSELLDDYEEGTWTPSINQGFTVSYTSNSGTYTKVGRLVYYNFYIQISSSSGSATDYSYAVIRGLPFTSVANTNIVGYGGNTIPWIYQLGQNIQHSYVDQNSTTIQLLLAPSGGDRSHASPSSTWNGGDTRIAGGGVYITSS